MTKFKTVAVPATALTGVKEKNMYDLATINQAIAPAAKVMEENSVGGWTLHSYVTIPATIVRKKGFFEKILGWIPIINLIWANKPDMITGNYCALIFSKEE